ncbi:MAG: prepilin-type N-terminal cleavage/methylation domain-containing protein [Gemmatimonadetes bacterium]|nr:prepilin-type N-terminal cleavage/methylation domain-containing protein [Gemmatimonadota bacterium]
MRNRSGFSLIEMVIVMVIIGVIVGISVPGLSTWYRGRAVHAARDRFASAHGLARSTAIRYGRLSELHLDASANKYWIEVDTTGGRDTIGGIWQDPPVTFTSTRSLLCFDQRGLPSIRTTTASQTCGSPDVKVIFTVQGASDTVETTVLGKVLR